MHRMWTFWVHQLKVVLIPKAKEYIFSFLDALVLVDGLVGSFGTAVPHNVKVNQNKSLSI